MNKKITKFLKYILSATVAAVLLYFSFREVDWQDFLVGLKTCRWEFILLSMATGVIAFWFRGLRWRQLLLPIDNSTKRITTFNAVNIGYIANFVFPRIGEFVRCGVVARRSQDKKASYDKVLGTVVLEKHQDILILHIKEVNRKTNIFRQKNALFPQLENRALKMNFTGHFARIV